MAAITSIAWTDRSWNPVRGCSRVSMGCDRCYAAAQAHRFSGPGQPFEGLTTIRRGKVDWAGIARLIPDQLAAPLKWRKPQRIFVNSMSDLFHPSLSTEEIAAVFGVMAACPHLTFQVLTKQPKRAAEWFKWLRGVAELVETGDAKVRICLRYALNAGFTWSRHIEYQPWPLPNVHLGVSAENQKTADERIPILLQRIPAAVRFVSMEPLLGQVKLTDLTSYAYASTSHHMNALAGSTLECMYDGGAGVVTHPKLDWVIVGGESGPGARPCDVAWLESIVQQCRGADVPCFVKQLGAHPCFMVGGAPFFHNYHHTHGELFCKKLSDKQGGDPSEWPESLRVRQFPGDLK